MAYLIDTSVLGRLANTSDAQYLTATRAVGALHSHGEMLRVAPQNLIEFRNVATRPVEANGLGLSASDAEAKIDSFESMFSLLEETADVFPAWKSLAHSAMAIGKQVHDVRIVAICQVSGIEHIFTFNTRHMTRFAALVPGLTVVDPRSAGRPGTLDGHPSAAGPTRPSRGCHQNNLPRCLAGHKGFGRRWGNIVSLC